MTVPIYHHEVAAIETCERQNAVAALKELGYVVLSDVGPDQVRAVLTQFGRIAPFMGEWKYDVAVREELATMYTARSFEALYPHLDKYEWPMPPDVVALYGRRADGTGAGLTHVCDMSPFLHALDAEDQARLRNRTISYEADEGLRAVGIDHRYAGPALDESDPMRPRFRFSYNYAALPANDPGFVDLWERTKAWYEANKQSVLLTEDTLLVWRNGVLLHSRDSFTDPDRYLWRVYLHDADRPQSQSS